MVLWPQQLNGDVSAMSPSNDADGAGLANASVRTAALRNPTTSTSESVSSGCGVGGAVRHVR